jgi:hypothetical protein
MFYGVYRPFCPVFEMRVRTRELAVLRMVQACCFHMTDRADANPSTFGSGMLVRPGQEACYILAIES